MLMPELKQRRVRSIRRLLVRPARQSWGAFSTSVLGGNIYVLVSQSSDAPEGGAHAVAIPARWLAGADGLDTTTMSSFDCKYGLTDIVLDTDGAQEEGRPMATISADRGDPVVAIVTIDVMKSLETDRGYLLKSDLLEAPRADSIDPADIN